MPNPNRRGFLFALLAAPLAFVGIKASPYTYGPDGSISIRFRRPMKRRDYIRDRSNLPYRVRECIRHPNGSLEVVRIYGVMGTTGYQKVGDIITRPANYEQQFTDTDAVHNRQPLPILFRDINTRVPIGKVLREATEDEFMELHHHCRVGRDTYRDTPNLFTFPRYYIVQTYPL